MSWPNLLSDGKSELSGGGRNPDAPSKHDFGTVDAQGPRLGTAGPLTPLQIPSLDWDSAIPWLRQHTKLQLWLNGGKWTSWRPASTAWHGLTGVFSHSVLRGGRRAGDPAQARRRGDLQPRRAAARRCPGNAGLVARVRTGSCRQDPARHRRRHPTRQRHLQSPCSGRVPLLRGSCCKSPAAIVAPECRLLTSRSPSSTEARRASNSLSRFSCTSSKLPWHWQGEL